MLINKLKQIGRIARPEYIRFNNFKLLIPSVNTLIDSITFKEDDINHIMSVEELNNLSKKYNRNIDLSYYEKEFIFYNKLLEEVNTSDEIKKDICENTFFESYEIWNITNLIRQYKLTSFDVFYSLINYMLPILKINRKDIEKEFYSREKDYVYFDYWNGIGIKNKFPIDINNNDTPFQFNIRRFNDRNNYSGFNSIIKLLEENKENKNEYKIYYPKIIVETNNFDNISFDAKLNDKINNYTKKSFQELQKDKCIEDKTLRYWSHRIGLYNNKEVWDYQTTNFYEKYIKDNLKFCDISCTFKFVEDKLLSQLNYNHNIPIEKISMVNMLAFGKTNIDFMMLERLLSFIRYSYNDSEFQLDNFLIKQHIYGDANNKRYDVLWRDDNIMYLKFAKTDIEKLYVAKKMLSLMNEIDPKYLNFHNYYHIGEWYRINDFPIQTNDNLQNWEQTRLDSKKKLYESNLFLESNQVVKKTKIYVIS